MRLVIALLLAAAAASCDMQKPAPPQGEQAPAPIVGLDRSRAGQPAPDTAFLAPDGEPATLADFEGRPLLLNLWATWCAPCVAEMPALDALAAREEKLQVLAVSQDIRGQEEAVARFFEERRLTSMEPFRDPELALMTSLEAATLPTTILYDARGREVWRIIGAYEWTGPEAAKLIAEAL